ncbi:uncharacterized protein LOC114582843 isoform X2 [Podarcis muralis]
MKRQEERDSAKECHDLVLHSSELSDSRLSEPLLSFVHTYELATLQVWVGKNLARMIRLSLAWLLAWLLSGCLPELLWSAVAFRGKAKVFGTGKMPLKQLQNSTVPRFFGPQQPWEGFLIPRSLRWILSCLWEEDLHKFKRKLREIPVLEGGVRIPEEALEEADASRLTDLLLSCYGEKDAVEVAANALRAVRCEDEGDRLLLITRPIIESAQRPHVHLLKTLAKLKESDWKKFKSNLQKFPIKEGFVNIQKELLECANTWDLSELLLIYYGEDYALEVTAEVLRAIGCESQADRLLTSWQDDSAMPPGVDRMQRDVGKKRTLGDGLVSGDEMICKGRQKLIGILKKNLEFILHVLHSRFIITRKEYVDFLETEEDFKQKSKKLLSTIQKRGEHACCWFLECVGMAFPGSIQSLLFEVHGLVHISGHSVLQSKPPLFAEEGKSTKVENPAACAENIMCSWCPSVELPGKIRPEVFWDSEKGHEKYRVLSTGAGSFRCGDTDLICEVREAATITYYFDSWPELLEKQNAEEWHVAGPVLNIQVDPVEAVSAVHFPHFLCLEGEDSSQVHIAHFVEEGMVLERPERVGPYHVVLENPTFSPRGVVYKKSWFKRKIKVHTVALLYQMLRLKAPTFHLYLLPNDSSLIKAVDEHEVQCPSHRIEKPPWTLKPLTIGSRFFVETNDVTVCPEELEFQYLDAEKLQQYLELSAEQMQDKFSFCLIEKHTNKLVWKAHVKQEELNSDEMNSTQASRDGTLTNAPPRRTDSGHGVESR